jgi:uncharacterized membrane protein YhaH (DUF805 family)
LARIYVFWYDALGSLRLCRFRFFSLGCCWRGFTHLFGLAAPRLRNAGHPPWFAMLAFVPKINWVVLLVLLFFRSKEKQPASTNVETTGKTT